MRVGDLEYFTVFMRIRDMSSSWFDPATEIPLLAAVLGLPAVGILLIRRHLRNAETA
jgi:hypothetical protein